MQTQGHRVLITGGSRGIGLALAQRFHHAGNQLILVGRDAQTLQAAAQSMPGTVVKVADLTTPGVCTALAQEFADVNILVNNAGIQRNGRFAELPAAAIREELALNLITPLELTYAYLPHLTRQASAAIVNITSVLALMPKESASVYCASKAGLRSHTQSLRWQLEGSAVRVFELMPPLVDTAMTAGRGSGKISPDAVADAFWRGFLADRQDIAVGKAKAARVLARFVPFLAERILRRG